MPSQPSTPLSPLRPGVRLGKESPVRLVRRIGQGGMGDVWLAHDESLHVDRAVKILHADRTDPAERRRFVEEGRLMAGLGEIPGLVHVHSAGMCPVTGQPFLVMDALLLSTEEIRSICRDRLGLTLPAANRIADADGASSPRPLTLQDILGDERDDSARQLPERAVLALARDIAAALARLHGRTPPVIHRDIKPANLLFAPDGRIRLGDFGIARELAPGRPGFTRTGLQPGTRRYAAPEQQDGRPPTPAVDWYALGVVLFRALYSSFPEWGEAFPTHSGLRPISPLWEPLLRDLLAKDPAHRLASPAAFLARLDAIERSLSPRPRRRHARAVLIGFLVILGCLGALGTLWFRSKGGSEDSGISDSSISSTTEHTEYTERYPSDITRAVPQAGDSGREDAAERQEDVSLAEDVSHAEDAENAEVGAIAEDSEDETILSHAEPVRAEPSPGEVRTVLLPGGVPLDLVWVPPGTFTMGLSEKERAPCETPSGMIPGDDNAFAPPRSVSVGRGFWLAKTELTQEQYAKIEYGEDGLPTFGANYPQAFFWRMAERAVWSLNRLGTGFTFRIPTAAEWEWAARGGPRGGDHAWSGSDDPDEVAWTANSWPPKDQPKPAFGWPAVATRRPNELGLFDMSGSFAEWCSDRYVPPVSAGYTLHGRSAQTEYRVVRGGSINTPAAYCRNGSFSSIPTDDMVGGLFGLRVAADALP